MVVTIEQQTIKFPTIDLSSSPKINRLTACNYWLLFLYRYYFVGRKQYGPYGSPWCIEQMKKIENSIYQLVIIYKPLVK